ncbi:glycosyltransferase family 4 protein [Bradyrhizobium sp. WYCCWR 12699]|uniref:glycosyltransferase family 4 protein n=1 Tax=Bradyrhizobium sp. WYCCWR 12699 TaxID=3064203 RepID=UPI0028A57F2F|nr:glycosyltransferase family 4 protein [Bradyrhizobium sp. WYCCWR 12699]MDT4743657.1 glycosyltransferase family 4 protein [Bradyrhizobium sp. WYCCWR 12699]
MKISIWHNIMWSRYKAAVFSSVYRQANVADAEVHVYQIAETDTNRTTLSPIDLSWHKYPFELLFKGASSDIPRAKLLSKMARLTWKDTADITILSGYEKPAVWLQALILTLKRHPFALFCDSTLYDQQQTFLRGLCKRIIFNWANGIFCYGARASEHVIRYGVPTERIFIRCQAAALPKNYGAEEAIRMRMEYAAPVGAPRYLYVGRLSPEKSLDHLLEAFSEVLRAKPEAKLVFVGSGPSEPDLRTRAATLGIEQGVMFAGSKSGPELFEEYAKASCFVLPSHSEPWGLVVNEALSYGCPVVVSHRCGCVPELIDEGRTGFSFEWGNIRQLSERMKTAPDVFSDVAVTARTCLKHIEPYNPDNAAKAILQGCWMIYDRSRNSRSSLTTRKV